jgi:hypothetical protein
MIAAQCKSSRNRARPSIAASFCGDDRSVVMVRAGSVVQPVVVREMVDHLVQLLEVH